MDIEHKVYFLFVYSICPNYFSLQEIFSQLRPDKYIYIYADFHTKTSVIVVWF
jgi:hypothetical protein